jgi:hypothetical protein
MAIERRCVRSEACRRKPLDGHSRDSCPLRPLVPQGPLWLVVRTPGPALRGFFLAQPECPDEKSRRLPPARHQMSDDGKPVPLPRGKDHAHEHGCQVGVSRGGSGGLRASIVAARPSGEWTDGAFPVLDPEGFYSTSGACSVSPFTTMVSGEGSARRRSFMACLPGQHQG